MRTPSSETIVVKPELIRLVRRMDSKKWQVHYKLDGIKTWFRQSTDTADVKAAAAIAERMWMKATFDHEDQLRVTSKRASDALKTERERQKAQRAQQALQKLRMPIKPKTATVKPIKPI
jgi:hypothetical protein